MDFCYLYKNNFIWYTHNSIFNGHIGEQSVHSNSDLNAPNRRAAKIRRGQSKKNRSAEKGSDKMADKRKEDTHTAWRGQTRGRDISTEG